MSDKDAALYRLSVQLDHRGGTVLGAEVTGRVALSPDARTLWTANEEALKGDGNGLRQGLYALRIGPVRGAGAAPRRAAPPSLPARGRSAAPGRRRAATARPP